ncbi:MULTISPECIES: hypothetical protein [Cohnella]|uniref:hypothetical protein n=1 Tax=Cohnella TaxID=329857 RepID=UPI0009BAACD5|nr:MULTISPECIES: hypothetical protein [Cohnella]MBN2984936.1 hypothetical protein [Cohnella algarum]
MTTITKEDGEQIRLSGEAEIPEGFPADVPIPANVAVTSSISGDDTATVSIETEMPFEEAVALYYGYAQEAGYSEAYKMEEADFFNYSGRKDNEQFVVTLQLDLEDNKTVTGILVYGKTEN